MIMLSDLNNLFEQPKNEWNKLKRISFDEEIKFLYTVNELDKVGVNSPPIYMIRKFW